MHAVYQGPSILPFGIAPEAAMPTDMGLFCVWKKRAKVSAQGWRTGVEETLHREICRYSIPFDIAERLFGEMGPALVRLDGSERRSPLVIRPLLSTSAMRP